VLVHTVSEGLIDKAIQTECQAVVIAGFDPRGRMQTVAECLMPPAHFTRMIEKLKAGEPFEMNATQKSRDLVGLEGETDGEG
jgi:hypothetical protein